MNEAGARAMDRTLRDAGDMQDAAGPKSAPLRRVASILGAVAADNERITLKEIATRVALPASTTHRLVKSMLDVGFLRYDASRRAYGIGADLTRVVQMSMDRATVALLSEPLLTRLANRFSLTAYVVQLAGERVRLAAHRVPDEPEYAVVLPGERFPIHATAAGKAVFAFQHPHVIEAQLARPLEKAQPATRTCPDAIRTELAEVRARGYAIAASELDPDIFAIACPVRSERAGVVFAVGLNGIERIMRPNLEKMGYAKALTETAALLAPLLAGR